MSLPPSFAKLGFGTPVTRGVRGKRRCLVGSEGMSGTGKTEFAMSAPGPLVLLGLDMGLEGVVDKALPPAHRAKVIGVKEYNIPAPNAETARHSDVWREFYKDFKAACLNPDVRSVVVDTASEAWDLMRLVSFGKLTKVPPLKYTEVNQDYRDLIRIAYDAGVNLILTHRLKKHYENVTKRKADGSESEVGEWDGTYDRQGFGDGDYLVQVNVRHFLQDGDFAIEVIKSRQNPRINGMVLAGPDCNFATLAQMVHGDTQASDWE